MTQLKQTFQKGIDLHMNNLRRINRCPKVSVKKLKEAYYVLWGRKSKFFGQKQMLKGK